MSSKKKRNGGDPNASSRNLDGRRLRTVNEAKALAEYLAVKPDMERKEKEARRKRWEQIVEAAERREEELKNGSKGRVDGQWIEDKEDAAERVREAVKAAMTSGNYTDLHFTKDEVHHAFEDQEDDPLESSECKDEGELGSASTSPDEQLGLDVKGKGKETTIHTNTYIGFDDSDEFMSDDTEDDEEGGVVLEKAGEPST